MYQTADPITTSLLGNKADSAGQSISAKLGTSVLFPIAIFRST